MTTFGSILIKETLFRSQCNRFITVLYSPIYKRDLTAVSIHDVLVCFVFNTLRPRQNGRRFVDDTFKRIFLNENVRISIKISLKFVPKGPVNNIPALVQRMAWRRSGDKPLSEPMMVSLLTHICVTRPQWVKPITLLGSVYMQPAGCHIWPCFSFINHNWMGIAPLC